MATPVESTLQSPAKGSTGGALQQEEVETNPLNTEKEKPHEKTILEQRIDVARKRVSYISAGSGTLSFVLASILKSQNEIVDKIAIWSSKAALMINAFGGFLERIGSKETGGSFAFGLDFLISMLAKDEELYQWRGFASGLDQLPALLESVADNPKITEKDFESYKSFPDSARKIGTALKVTVQDIVNELKPNKSHSENIFKNLKHMLLGKQGEKLHTAEKNLLLSGIGMIGGAFIGTVLGFKKLGATIRDISGLYGDAAVYDAGRNGKDEAKKKEYFKSGIYYTIGSVLDLIYRWTGLPNLHLFAIGADRLGACFYVNGVGKNGNTKNA